MRVKMKKQKKNKTDSRIYQILNGKNYFVPYNHWMNEMKFDNNDKKNKKQ